MKKKFSKNSAWIVKCLIILVGISSLFCGLKTAFADDVILCPSVSNVKAAIYSLREVTLHDDGTYTVNAKEPKVIGSGRKWYLAVGFLSAKSKTDAIVKAMIDVNLLTNATSQNAAPVFDAYICNYAGNSDGANISVISNSVNIK